MAAQIFTKEFGYRLGRTARRAVRSYLRHERTTADWLAVQGVPAVLTTPLLWGIKLAVAGSLLYIAFWLAMLVVFAIAVVLVAPNIDWDDDQQPEWRMGLAGYGLYRGEIRIDPMIQTMRMQFLDLHLKVGAIGEMLLDPADFAPSVPVVII
ncbi:hypothetical protein ACO34A_23680 (plasmid) [Rhizobium sp. ACO-34A]|nr:hypothetical protein ACO34A_23680 [Rhizobium sp. ACO-34A]